MRYVAVDDVATAVACWALADDPPLRVEFGGPEALSRNEVANLVESAARRTMKRRRVPRPVLVGGSRILKRLKPELATVMGLSLMMDDGADWSDQPLRELGIEPRSASPTLRRRSATESRSSPLKGWERHPRTQAKKGGI